MDDELQKLNAIRTDPTIARWKDELRAIVGGNRENRLRHLGGVQEYIEVLQANASDVRAARETFDEALTEFVSHWQPARFQPVHEIELMLDLLTAFTPYTGFLKVADQLRVWEEFSALASDGLEADASTTAALRRQALDVLRSYFPVAPPDPSLPAFRSYVEILEDNLENPVHCGRALARLLDLHIFSLDGEEVRTELGRHPHAIRDLVEYAFQPVNSARLSRILPQLYRTVTETGPRVEEHFTGALNRFQAVIRDEPDRSVIELTGDGGVILELPVGAADPARYILTRWNREEAAGNETLARIMRQDDLIDPE